MRRRADAFRLDLVMREISLATRSSAFRVARCIAAPSSPSAGASVATSSSRLASTWLPAAAMARAAG